MGKRLLERNIKTGIRQKMPYPCFGWRRSDHYEMLMQQIIASRKNGKMIRWQKEYLPCIRRLAVCAAILSMKGRKPMYQQKGKSPVQEVQEDIVESMEKNIQSLGKKIKYFREQREITQLELAEKLSVTRQAVSNWERDKTLPDVYTLQQIAEFFGMTLDGFMEGTKEAEATMPKTPSYLAAATGAVIAFYLIAGGITSHLYVETVVSMVIIGVFCQLFLHLYFNSAVKTGNFFALAGYDSKVEYHMDEVKKVLIQMDTHVACSSFGTVLLFGIGAFCPGNKMDHFWEILMFVYCVDLTAALMLYNYRSLDRTLVKELDKKMAKAGFLSVVWFAAWIFVFIGVIFAKFAIGSIENNSREAVGYLGWVFLFLLITMAEFFYEQYRVKKEMEKTGSYRPGAAFWIGTALAGALIVLICL